MDYQKIFVTKTEEFTNYIQNKYLYEEYNVRKNYSDSFLVETSVGGSEGGSCWGGTSACYTKDSSEIAESLAGSISYLVMEFFSDYIITQSKETILSFIKKDGYFDYVEKRDGYGDYYGNYTSYALYNFKVLPIMEQLLDREYFELFQNTFNNLLPAINQTFLNNEKNRQIKELEDKINNFETVKNDELEKMKKNLEHYNKLITQLKNSIYDFEKNKNTELQSLVKQLNKIKK